MEEGWRLLQPLPGTEWSACSDMHIKGTVSAGRRLVSVAACTCLKDRVVCAVCSENDSNYWQC